MKKTSWAIITWAITLLFLIQMAGTLVESIYILDLMNTSLDEKALGILFFFSPVLLFLLPGKRPDRTAWILAGLLIIARGLTPYLDTLGRMLASGIGTGASLCLLPYLLTANPRSAPHPQPGSWISTGLALAVGLSALLRTINYGLDLSLVAEGGWAGWLLGAGLGFSLYQWEWKGFGPLRSNSGSVSLAAAGIFLVIGLAWFAFSAPAVIARWTAGDYRLIVLAVSLLALAWVGISLGWPRWLEKISPTGLLIWNLTFSLALVLTILSHRVPFPQTPESAPVVVGSPTWLQSLLLVTMLLLFPVIFLDLEVLGGRIRQADPRPRDLLPGILLGCFTLILLVFMQIFSNVWGYVEPVSLWFRNKFWLPYLLLAGLLTLLVGRRSGRFSEDRHGQEGGLSWGWAVFLALLFLGTAASTLITTRVEGGESSPDSLVVMTYNIQQANDNSGERSYREQLALIQQVNPDILALQESDSSRVSLNNNDYVRYYAGRMGYYSYYGPTTVTGTFGTAILSRYPLQNTRSAFAFSDQDEIGTAEAEIMVGGKLFTIYNVHPDGSDTAMLAWADSLLERAQAKSWVIALGDYNLRDYEQAYQLIAGAYTNAWVSSYPSEISPDGTDMSGENRIDHIFLSAGLIARDPEYILPPESATDHPVHWAEIIWK